VNGNYPARNVRIGVWRYEWHATINGSGQVDIDYGPGANPRLVHKTITTEQVLALAGLLVETEAWQQEPNIFVSADVPLAWVFIHAGDEDSQIMKPISSLLRSDRFSRILAFVEPFARRDK
jgi:hypothetical protein